MKLLVGLFGRRMREMEPEMSAAMRFEGDKFGVCWLEVGVVGEASARRALRSRSSSAQRSSKSIWKASTASHHTTTIEFKCIRTWAIFVAQLFTRRADSNTRGPPHPAPTDSTHRLDTVHRLRMAPTKPQLHRDSLFGNLSGPSPSLLLFDHQLIQLLLSLLDRVCLITGGGSGLGAMFASALCQNGAHVFIASRKAAQLKEVSDRLTKEGPGKCEYIVADIGTKAGCDALVAEVFKRTNKLNIVRRPAL